MAEETSFLNLLETVCRGFPGIELAILFGSMAAGRADSKSDLDIAVAGSTPLDWQTKAKFIEQLSVIVLRPIDLVDLQTAHGTILQQVLTTGRLLFCRDHGLYARLIRRMLFDQADFQPLVRRIYRERRKRWITV